MKALVQRLLACVVSDYRINWIYAASVAQPVPLGPDEEIVPLAGEWRERIAASTTRYVRNSLSYNDAGMPGLVLVRGREPLGTVHVAGPAQYDRTATWPLRSQEMAVIDLATEEAARGQGIGPRLMAMATAHCLNQGAARVICFIWWSNTPSTRAVSKAGWKRIGLSLEWQSFGRWWHLHLPVWG
jgi:RimJ/RimL family protein N-acetyltransferase